MPFFVIGMKSDLFQSCGHWWVFQICWHIECTFTASSFRIWNSSTGIPSHPLALFVVMLSKAHLTSHSRMSGSRSVITPLWLSGSWQSFLYSSSVYSCHLFLISSASVRSIPFLSFIVPIFTWNVPLSLILHLGCKSRESRNTWSNRKIWPWSTEWSRAKASRILPKEYTGHSKHPLPTSQEMTTRGPHQISILKSDWLYSLQPKMEKLYTVSKDKIRSWLWLRSWTPYCQIQT